MLSEAEAGRCMVREAEAAAVVGPTALREAADALAASCLCLKGDETRRSLAGACNGSSMASALMPSCMSS